MVLCPPAFITICGPQAAGKSTIATALAQALRGHGEQVALVELDAIAQMAHPTLPSWPAAISIFSSVARQWSESGMRFVIAEGLGWPGEVDELTRHAPEGSLVLRVAATAPYEDALSRAQLDPSRGVSRESEFLRNIYDKWNGVLPDSRFDLLLDTAELQLEECVAAIFGALEGNRGEVRARSIDAGP